MGAARRDTGPGVGRRVSRGAQPTGLRTALRASGRPPTSPRRPAKPRRRGRRTAHPARATRVGRSRSRSTSSDSSRCCGSIPFTSAGNHPQLPASQRGRPDPCRTCGSRFPRSNLVRRPLTCRHQQTTQVDDQPARRGQPVPGVRFVVRVMTGRRQGLAGRVLRRAGPLQPGAAKRRIEGSRIARQPCPVLPATRDPPTSPRPTLDPILVNRRHRRRAPAEPRNPTSLESENDVAVPS